MFYLKSQLSVGFTLSAHRLFIEKAVDTVGLCHHPPEEAVVLCVDENPGACAPRTGPSHDAPSA
jgi:hypothetical protein